MNIPSKVYPEHLAFVSSVLCRNKYKTTSDLKKSFSLLLNPAKGKCNEHDKDRNKQELPTIKSIYMVNTKPKLCKKVIRHTNQRNRHKTTKTIPFRSYKLPHLSWSLWRQRVFLSIWMIHLVLSFLMLWVFYWSFTKNG